MNRLFELLGDTYKDLPWQQARNMRNLIVYEYHKVDYVLVYQTVLEDLPIVKESFQSIRADIIKNKLAQA